MLASRFYLMYVSVWYMSRHMLYILSKNTKKKSQQLSLTLCTVHFISIPGIHHVHDMLNHTSHNYSNTCLAIQLQRLDTFIPY